MKSSDDLLRQAKSTVDVVTAEPRRRLAVVTCIDVRLDPLAIYGAAAGDIHVIRNAGGLVNGDVLRSLLISQYRLDTTQIDLMMHTDCGVQNLDSGALARTIAAATGEQMSVDFGGFSDLEEELHKGVNALRAAQALRHRDRIRGLVFDVDTKRTSVVVPI